jgi:hypothetical protein
VPAAAFWSQLTTRGVDFISICSVQRLRQPACLPALSGGHDTISSYQETSSVCIMSSFTKQGVDVTDRCPAKVSYACLQASRSVASHVPSGRSDYTVRAIRPTATSDLGPHLLPNNWFQLNLEFRGDILCFRIMYPHVPYTWLSSNLWSEAHLNKI